MLKNNYFQSFSNCAPMAAMVFTMKYLYGNLVLLFVSSTCSASNENEVPSKITINDSFNNPAILNPVSLYGSPQVVSNFLHQGTNFFFNPNILLGTSFPLPLGAVVAAVQNSSNVEIQVNETVTLPELPSITPVEVISEEPIKVIAPPPQPPLIPVISEVPEVPVSIQEIPPAPVLPPLVIPKIPVWFEESIEVVPAWQDKEIVITETKRLPTIVIPQAPSLPPLTLTPKIIVPEIEAKTHQAVVAEKEESTEFSKMKLVNEESILQIVPRLPVTEIDFTINEIPKINELSNIEELFYIDDDKKVVMMPPTLELPVIEISKLISDVILIEKDKDLGLPTSIPTDCARNIVLERILPNMISKKTVTKSLEIISFPAVKYPVIPKPLIPAL